MKNKKAAILFFLSICTINCAEDEIQAFRTIEQQSTQNNLPEPTYQPATITLYNDPSIVFASLNDYPIIRTALLDLYDGMFLPQDRFSFLYDKLHKEDATGNLSSTAIKNEFLNANPNNLRQKYHLMLLLGLTNGESAIDFLHEIAISPINVNLSIDDERHELEYSIRVTAARNIYRIYKTRSSPLAYDSLLTILASSSNNIEKDVVMEIISHLKTIDNWTNGDFLAVLNNDLNYLLDITSLAEPPQEIIIEDPLKADPINDEAPIMLSK